MAGRGGYHEARKASEPGTGLVWLGCTINAVPHAHGKRETDDDDEMFQCFGPGYQTIVFSAKNGTKTRGGRQQSHFKLNQTRPCYDRIILDQGSREQSRARHPTRDRPAPGKAETETGGRVAAPLRPARQSRRRKRNATMTLRADIVISALFCTYRVAISTNLPV